MTKSEMICSSNEHSSSILVSVIMPTYKRKPKIWMKAIESVMNQTYQDIELIIIDDNDPRSDYRTINRKTIQEISSSRIVYIENETNLGGAIARNRGIEIASGDYIAFLDDDDEFINDKIDKQLDFMICNQLDACFSNMRIFSKGRLCDLRTFYDITDYTHEGLLRYHIAHQITGTPSFMYRKEFINSIDGFDDALMGQEFFLMLKSIMANGRVDYFDQFTVNVNRSADSISFSKSKIDGEQKIYQTKCDYFSYLTKQQKAYVKFRHHVICAVAYFRIYQYHRVIPYLVLALVSSPRSAVLELKKLMNKRIAIINERRSMS